MTVNFRKNGKTQNVSVPTAASTPTLVALNADCVRVDSIRILSQTNSLLWVAIRAAGDTAPTALEMLESYPIGPNTIEVYAKNEGLTDMYLMVEQTSTGRVSLTPGRGA